MENSFDEFEYLASKDWGTYYLSRYYFSIQTKWRGDQVGLSKEHHELSEEIQRQLQEENLPAIFHEFFHYIHDVSTVLSGALFQNRLLMISIFTSYLDPNPSSSVSLGTNKNNPSLAMNFVNSWRSNEILSGSGSLEFPMLKIERILPGEQEIYFPIAPEGKRNGKIHIPVISYSGYKDGQPAISEINLGRFYLFEFLAYEIDQILDMRQRKLAKIEDPLKFTEYTVCRMVAQYIFPAIKQEVAMAAGLIALQHIDAGHAFISMLQQIRDAFYQGVAQEVALKSLIDSEKRILNKYRGAFFAQQDAYVNAFKGRTQLETAFNYLAEINKKLYEERIKNPCFELEWHLNGEYDKILDAATLCDYLYKFLPDDTVTDPEFDRDFMGTNLPEEISIAMKTLVAYDHYFFSHRGGMSTPRVEATSNQSYRCPFYTCCNLPDRIANAAICNSYPWRIYEIQYHRDKKYCWYASGVLEAKGISTRRM